MERLIVLLRGVMPTGKNRVPMAELRKVLDRERLPRRPHLDPVWQCAD